MVTRPHCGTAGFIPVIPEHSLSTAARAPQHRAALRDRHGAGTADGVSRVTMTFPAHQAGHGGWAPLRAVTAVIALYAFVLNAILGGLVPLPASISHGVLCLGQADDAGPAMPDSSHAHHQSCCTVAGPK